MIYTENTAASHEGCMAINVRACLGRRPYHAVPCCVLLPKQQAAEGARSIDRFLRNKKIYKDERRRDRVNNRPVSSSESEILSRTSTFHHRL
jgi:hypothetical protein